MASFEQLYPEQFDSDYLGTSVGAGWLPLIANALARTRAELTHEEMAAFRWRQIKEKFGRLSMYWNSSTVPVWVIEEGGYTTLSVDIAGHADSDPATAAFKESLATKIDAIVEAAEREALRTCERCAQPGRLYSDGYWATLCDEHAENRVFPPQYGVWLDARAHQAIGSPNRVRTERAMYFRGVVLYSWCSPTSTKDYVMIEDMPPWLVAHVRSNKLPETKFQGLPACLADDVESLVIAHADELRGHTRMALPAGARIDPAQAFALAAAHSLGVRRVELQHLVVPKSITIAGVRHPDGTLRIFKDEFGEITEIAEYQEIFLERRAKDFEKVAAGLRDMLTAFKETNT